MDEISWVLDPRPPMNTILEYLGYGVSDVVVKRSQDIYSRFFTVLFFGGDSQDYIFRNIPVENTWDPQEMDLPGNTWKVFF